MIPGTLTLALSPKAVGVSLLLSLSLSFNSLSLLLVSKSVLAEEVAGECGKAKALPAAAAVAKGDVVAFAKEPKEGTEVLVVLGVVVVLSFAAVSFVVVEDDLNPPNPELLPNPPNVGCLFKNSVSV